MKPDYAYTMITVWSIADDVAVCQTKNSVSTSPTVQMMIRWILRSATWRLITTSRHIQRLTSSLLLPQLKVLSTLCPEMWITTYTLIPAITRHSLVRVKGEVFVLLYVFSSLPPPQDFSCSPCLLQLETDRKWFLSYSRNRKVVESMQTAFDRNRNKAESYITSFGRKPEPKPKFRRFTVSVRKSKSLAFNQYSLLLLNEIKKTQYAKLNFKV